MAHLDGAVRRVDPQEAGHAHGTVLGHDREEHRVRAAGHAAQPGAVRPEVLERPVREVSPHPPLLVHAVGTVEVLSVAGRIHRLQAAPLACQCRRDRRRSAGPVGDRLTDGLAEVVVGGHPSLSTRAAPGRAGKLVAGATATPEGV